MKPGSAFDKNQGTPNLEALAIMQSELNSIDKVKNIYHVVETVIDADRTGGIAVNIPKGAKIVDFWSIATATSASGTVKMQTNGGSPADIATAIALAADGAVARLAAGFDDTKRVVGDDGVRLITNGAADRGFAYIGYLL